MAAMAIGSPPPSKNSSGETVEKRGDGSTLFLWRGKVAKESTRATIYRGKSPGTHQTTSQIVSLTESRIESRFG
jgi:hypothetical protein